MRLGDTGRQVMNILEWEAGQWRLAANYPKTEKLVGECGMWACLGNTISTNEIGERDLEVTNIICASVLLDMSTPDKKKAAESLDSRINWRSTSINSCFLGCTRVKFVSGTWLGRDMTETHHQYGRPLLDDHDVASFTPKHCREYLSRLFWRKDRLEAHIREAY